MILWLAFVIAFGFSACARVVAPPPAPPSVPPSVPQPTFEKTFGTIHALPNAGLTFDYKTIRLAVDPDAAKPQPDYVLLTGVDGRRFGVSIQKELKENTKILAAESDVPTLKKSNFNQVKSMGPGQRIMLKKDDGYLFASAAAGQSYLLEFDNGKNIFVAGSMGNVDALRPFVYDLRDDGREIEIGIFRVETTFDEEKLAAVIGLLQPKNVVFVIEPGGIVPNLDHFRETLKAEFFEGPIVIVKPDETIPF